MQVDRQKEVQKMYKYTYRRTEIKTYRHTQTNRQTEDSAKVLVQAENRQMYRKTNIHTYCTYVQYCT